MVTGYRCAVCGVRVDVGAFAPWQCPNRSSDDPYHVLHLVDDEAADTFEARSVPAPDDPDPIVRFGPRSAWWAFGVHRGLDASDLVALARNALPGFVTTPFERSDVLSVELDVEVWAKDETANVAGSHKARHLAGILLHLLVAERVGLLHHRPRLAIASCGNAALAAATLASRVEWPLDVFVPTWMDPAFGARLDDLGARIHRCERRADDPPGDPAMLRFRAAVADGAIPFTVQGPENALCLDTGRTIGWEIAEQADAHGVALDRVVIQVGGGAFAACVGAGLGSSVRLDTVQAEGCAPLAAAWHRMSRDHRPETAWADVMRPWPEPHSAADGILDDETYDWVAVARAMRASGGEPIVAAETEVVRAHELARHAGFDASATGSAGLAGVLHVRHGLPADARVAVVMSGVART